MAWLFISHSSADDAVAEHIQNRLRAEGFEGIFLDFDPEEGIPPGRDWERELYSQLRKADAVVFLNSPTSVTSQWCFAELALARSISKVVVPVIVVGREPHPLLANAQWIDLTAGDKAFEALWREPRRHELDPQQSLPWDRPVLPIPASPPSSQQMRRCSSDAKRK